MGRRLALAAALGLALPAGARAADPAAERAFRDWVTGFDTLHDEFPRPGLITDLQTPYGTAVDISCRQGLSEADAQKAADAFKAATRRSLEAVKSCSEKLSGVPYFHDLVAVMRRLVVVCTKKSEDKLFQGKEAAGAYAKRRRLKDALDPRMRREGADNRPANESRTYFMVIPDSLKDFTDTSFEWQAATLLHESAHYTGAGNRRDHDRLERVKQDADKPCVENEFDDRIRFFEAACGFRVKDDKTFNRVSELRYRVRTCGLERACVQVLTRVDAPVDQSQGYGFFESIFKADEIEANQKDADRELSRTFNRREAALVCGRVNAALGDGEASARTDRTDIESMQRLTMAMDYIRREAGGLLGGIPAYYRGAMPVPDRIALAGIADLEARVEMNCAARSLPPAAADESRYLKKFPAEGRRILKPFDDLLADEACPLSLASKLPGHAHEFARFHNLEQKLQEVSLGFLDELSAFAGSAGASLDGIEDRIRVAYLMRCAGSTEAFRPRLCEGGERVLLQAAGEVRARHSLPPAAPALAGR